jgi:hypothetical protein
MLAVAVNEQHGAIAGMFEPREQRGFLAEIARQRDHLHVGGAGGQGMGDRKCIVARSVIDINEFAAQAVLFLQPARDAGEHVVQTGQSRGFVEARHDNRQTGLGADR